MTKFYKSIIRKVGGSLLNRIRMVFATESERRHSMAGPVKLWKMKRRFQIEYLKKVGIKSRHYLLDLGCGTLRGGIPIIKYLQKGHYYGVECREQVLDEGKKELIEHNFNHKEPILILSDNFSSIECKQSFDYIWAFSVLIHMEDKILDDCLDFVHRHLKPSGFFYANVNIGHSEGGNWQGFPIVYRSLNFYKETASSHGLYVSNMGSLRSLGHVSGSPAGDAQRMLRFNKIKTNLKQKRSKITKK